MHYAVIHTDSISKSPGKNVLNVRYYIIPIILPSFINNGILVLDKNMEWAFLPSPTPGPNRGYQKAPV